MLGDNTTKTFIEWLEQFIEREIPFGDLARDMRDDFSLPKSNKRSDFEWHLSKYNACINANSTLEKAFDEYEKYLINHRESFKNKMKDGRR